MQGGHFLAAAPCFCSYLLLVFPLTSTLLHPGSATGCCPFRSVPAPVWVPYRHSVLPRLRGQGAPPFKSCPKPWAVQHASSCLCCSIPSCVSFCASSHLLLFLSSSILSCVPMCPLQSPLPQRCCPPLAPLAQQGWDPSDCQWPWCPTHYGETGLTGTSTGQTLNPPALGSLAPSTAIKTYETFLSQGSEKNLLCSGAARASGGEEISH